MTEINLDEVEETLNNVNNIKTIFDECLVDLNKELPPIDTIVYVGNDFKGRKVSALTRYECSCIYAPSKAKKSFAKSLIEAAYIGGQTSKYTKHFVGSNREDKYLISIDTEQGEFYAQRGFRRISKIVGKQYPKYIPLQLRKQSVQNRLDLIRWIVYESEYAGKIDLITIDGLADLVTNTNDIEMSTALAEEMMKWTAEGLHICFILHKNNNSQKARGHIGTVSTIKAETLISIDNLVDDNGNITEKNTVKISCSHSRGIYFEDFYLTINDFGLPFTHDYPEDNTFKDIEDSNNLPKYEPKEAFKDVPF